MARKQARVTRRQLQSQRGGDESDRLAVLGGGFVVQKARLSLAPDGGKYINPYPSITTSKEFTHGETKQTWLLYRLLGGSAPREFYQEGVVSLLSYGLLMARDLERSIQWFCIFFSFYKSVNASQDGRSRQYGVAYSTPYPSTSCARARTRSIYPPLLRKKLFFLLFSH